MSKVTIQTRTRIIIEGCFDLQPIHDTFGDWAREKKLFISGRYNEADNYTVVYVSPFERIHRQGCIRHTDGRPNQVCEDHEIVFYGVIPSDDGKPMDISEITDRLIMPAKRKVNKEVAICAYSSTHEETGSGKTKFAFCADSRCKDPAAALSKCKDELGDSILDIVDSDAASKYAYAKELDTITPAIAEFVRSFGK